tara:strand:+ start:447 stop:683 length:237 start_codon:yes stop_codon:yes gene_type:complete
MIEVSSDDLDPISKKYSRKHPTITDETIIILLFFMGTKGLVVKISKQTKVSNNGMLIYIKVITSNLTKYLNLNRTLTN